MERISLPVRTVTTRGWVAVPVAAAVILLTLLWMGHALAAGLFAPYLFGDFQAVVLTGEDISRPRASGEPEIWTLFVEAGRMHALEPAAKQALYQLDSWNGEMQYVFAQAVWRDYNAPETSGRAPSGRLRDSLPPQVRVLLLSAIRCEPMNAFYRQTLLGLDVKTGAAETRRAELVRAADEWAPQNSWGQLRAADYLIGLGDNRSRALPHYLRALDLMSGDIMAGLTDPLVKPSEGVPAEGLAPLVVRRVLDGLFANVGDYDLWTRSQDFADLSPEVHYLLWRRLRAMNKAEEARKESETVVSAVEERLRVEQGVSTLQAFLEIVNPLMQPNYSKRFLTGFEIAHAAEVLRQSGRPEDAIRLYRTEISRMPGSERARLDLVAALIEAAEALSKKAQESRDNNDKAQADKLELEARARYDEAEKQVVIVQEMNPQSNEAILLRGRLPGGAGTPVQ